MQNRNFISETEPMISAILLAAGESKRMGKQNKLLLPFGGKPLIRHMAQTLLQCEAAETIVVVGCQAEAVAEAIADLPLQIVFNRDYQQGITSTIQTGVRAAAAESAGFMICLSDLPLISPQEYNLLMQTFQDKTTPGNQSIAIPVYRGERGNPVLFAPFYRQKILAHQDKEGCRGIVKQHARQVVLVDMPTAHILLDIDTPDSYRELSGHNS